LLLFLLVVLVVVGRRFDDDERLGLHGTAVTAKGSTGAIY
jgi:hypothetical protein